MHFNLTDNFTFNDNPPQLAYDRARLALLFDQIAHHARETGGEPKAKRIDTLVKNESLTRLDLNKDDSLLDLGCGMGRILFEVAPVVRWGYGVDISKVSLASARARATEEGHKNLLFGHGAIEAPSLEINIAAAEINKMLLLWSLHHLPDNLKGEALTGLVRKLRKPGRIVIGDLMFFEPPDKHKLLWDRVGYDGGLTDHPSTADFLKRLLMRLGGAVEVFRLHPLAGVIAASWE